MGGQLVGLVLLGVRLGVVGVFAGIAQQLAVDQVGEPAFEAAHGFFVALAFGSFALVVVTPGALAADLAERHGVQGGVELAVPGPGEPVAYDIAGGDFDRSSAGV